MNAAPPTPRSSSNSSSRCRTSGRHISTTRDRHIITFSTAHLRPPSYDSASVLKLRRLSPAVEQRVLLYAAACLDDLINSHREFCRMYLRHWGTPAQTPSLGHGGTDEYYVGVFEGLRQICADKIEEGRMAYENDDVLKSDPARGAEQVMMGRGRDDYGDKIGDKDKTEMEDKGEKEDMNEEENKDEGEDEDEDEDEEEEEEQEEEQ
ncbi:hypothetical protein N0V88_000338 [Collariella sp. IMI 366227]|nr:hypothetical protein N0V88_000338 [Collariella sp. IMI 366227]